MDAYEFNKNVSGYRFGNSKNKSINDTLQIQTLFPNSGSLIVFQMRI